MDAKSKPITAAFLGPIGSYTELALQKFSPPQEGLACRTFREVFTAVAGKQASYGFVPIENVIKGPITETLDLLYEFRGQVYVEHSFTMEIEHCLGVLPGTSAKDLSSICSREQALEQCAEFLASRFPDAELLTARSTAAAAEQLSTGKTKGQGVIAARETLESCGLEVLEQGIADRKNNKTRFVLLRAGDISSVEATLPTDSRGEYVTHLIVDPGKDRQGLLYELLNVISVRHGANLMFVHSRPDPRGIFIFHLSLEGHVAEPNIRACIESLEEFCRTTTGETAQISVVGSFAQQPFVSPPFRSIGIVGGNGKMGRWFKSFFESAGIEVSVSDTDNGLTLSELVKQSEVILLSVPMSAGESVLAELLPLLQAGQLLVENCSIKSCLLPRMLEGVAPGVEVLGIHTMFADDVPSLRGENIVITRTARSGVLADAVENLFYKFGAKLSHLDGPEHDTLSAFFQSLFHATMIALAETMKESIDNREMLETFSTPNSRAVLNTMQRVLHQNEELLLDLQTLNAEYPNTRRIFLQILFRLFSSLNQGDSESFLTSVRESRKFLDSNSS